MYIYKYKCAVLIAALSKPEPEPDMPPPLLPTESTDDNVEVSTQISEYDVVDNSMNNKNDAAI